MTMSLSRLPIIFVFFLPLYKTYGEITFSEQFDTLPSNFTTTYYGGSTASDFERNTIDDALNILTVGSRAESEIVMKYDGNINSADYDTSGGIVYFTVLAGNSADVAEGSTYFDNDGDLTYTNVAEACLQFSNFNGDGEVILLNENGNKRISYSNENYIDVGSIDSVYLRLSYNFNTDIYGEYYSYDGVNFILLNEQYAPNDDFSIVIGAYSKLTEFEQGDIYFDNFVISDSTEYTVNNNTGTDIGNTDADGDGLSDSYETNTSNTNPNNADTDGDSITDGDEVNTYFTNPNDIDTDNDGLTDSEELISSSYALINGSYTWQEARDDAISRGGHLATVTSSSEWNAIVELWETVPPNIYWLGASDEEQEGVWKWVTGENWTVEFWDDINPNNDGGEENMLTIERADGIPYWNDTEPWGVRSYILETTNSAFFETDPNNADSDSDGLIDGDELNRYSTNPLDSDSDNDSSSDSDEILNGTDPNDPSDFYYDIWPPTDNCPDIAISPNNSSYIVGESITIDITLCDSDTSVSSVEVYNGSTLLGAANRTSNNTFRFNYTFNVAGSMNLQVFATYEGGNVVTATPIQLIVSPGSTPTVAITSPFAGDSITAGDNVEILVNATDADGVIAVVEIFGNGEMLGLAHPTGVFAEYRFDLSTDIEDVGTLYLEARATDDMGNVASSDVINLNVINGKPISQSPLFETTGNPNWPYFITLAETSEGESSQEEQTLDINV